MRPRGARQQRAKCQTAFAARVLVRPPNRCAARHSFFVRHSKAQVSDAFRFWFASATNEARLGLLQKCARPSALIFATEQARERLRLELACGSEINRLAAQHDPLGSRNRK